MRRTSLATLSLLFFLTMASPAFAMPSTSVTDRLQTIRADQEDRVTDRAENRGKKREHLFEIRDERRRDRARKLEERIAAINERWTNHWSRLLDRLSKILAKIGTRATRASENGVDVSKVRELIALAETAIRRAQSAVDEQAVKVYTLVITDDTEIRSAAKALVAEFRGDLRATRDVVRSARGAVHDVFAALKDIIGRGRDAE